MSADEHQRIGKAHVLWIKNFKVDIEPTEGCFGMLEILKSYATQSAPFNVACMIAKYRGVDPVGVRKMHAPIKGDPYRKIKVPFKRMTSAIACASWHSKQLLERDSLWEPEPLQVMQQTAPIQHVTNNEIIFPTRFTVYRNVDYFQLLDDPSNTVYTAELPFTIKNFTVSSTSIDVELISGFQKEFSCMLILNVPFTYSCFIAIGSGIGSYQGEILFPDDAEFVIEIAMVKVEGEGKHHLKLIGRVKDSYSPAPCDGVMCPDPESISGGGPLSGGPLLSRSSKMSKVSKASNMFARVPSMSPLSLPRSSMVPATVSVRAPHVHQYLSS